MRNPSARPDILIRTPWLLAIGRMLRADYTERLPERLAALAKKLQVPSPAIPGKGDHAATADERLVG